MQLSETEKEILGTALDLLVAKASMELNTAKFIDDLADVIDSERELSPDRRLKDLRESVESIKIKAR